MKDVKKIAEGKNFSAVDFGKLNELGDYVLSMGDIKIPGKVFGGQALGNKGSEFSFQIYAPGQEGGFYHTHKTHEELYFVLTAPPAQFASSPPPRASSMNPAIYKHVAYGEIASGQTPRTPC